MLGASLVILAIVIFLLIKAAYYQGVIHGAGAMIEPKNPEYSQSKEWLKKHMKHRWKIKD